MKKGTLVAIGVFAVLLLLFLTTRERQVSEGVTKLELSGLEKDAISGLEFSGPRSATLRKEGDAWVVIDPAKPDTKHPADEVQVRSALDSLPALNSSELVTERAEKHAELEVDDAHGSKVRLLKGGQPVAELIFGKTARNGTYVRKAGSNTVFATPSRLGWIARREFNSWRKRDFMELKPEELAQVTVRPAGAEPYTLEAGDAGSWKLKEPAQPPADFRFDPQVARSMVHQLTSLSAQDFAQGLSDDKTGLAGPHDVLEARLKDGKVVTVHLGTQSDPRDAPDASLLKQRFSFADGAGTADSKVTLEDLQKVAATPEQEEDLRKVATRLMSDPAAFARLDTGGFAANPKDGAITLDDLNGASKTLGLVPVRKEGDAQLYMVSAPVAQGLRKRLTELRDLSLLSFDPQKVTRLSIQAGGKKTVVVKDGSTWKLTQPEKLPAGFEFDPSRVDAQLSELKGLRAARWLETPVSDADAGLGKPSAVVELTLEGGGTQSLRFGKETTSATGAAELFVKGAVDTAVYATHLGQRTRFEPGVELFKKLPTAPETTASMQGFESLPPDIRRQIEQQLRSGRSHP
ncbi:DUF4340 domain-containing protein [Hyalangium gracile]|uniref:DUF4340 domain-containing protein n=1 Tax=Hyalangium gracile TaxID=394092 RepID=UPI001CCC0C23|nr:DUF4340 domain-containing protein [Hyalangium gracile]